MPRRRRSRRRSSAPVKQRYPSAFFLDEDQLLTDFDSLADASSVTHLIVDNSIGFGNEVVHLNKITTQYAFLNQSAGANANLLIAVMRQNEGESAIDLGSASAVRDARNENKMLRGPWQLTLHGEVKGQRTQGKTLILKDLTLDQNDDLKIIFQNESGAALAAAGPHMYAFTRAYYKKVGT